jgi:predicted glycosyltransferase
MPNPLKVFFPIESLAGLGHFNRASLLVQAMIEAGMEVTVASGTFVHENRFFPNAKRIVLPRYVHKNRDGIFTAWNEQGQKICVENHSNTLWKRQRSDALREVVRLVRPDIVIFEFWPFSRRNITHEVVAVLKEARTLGLDPLKICSVRDVIKGDVKALSASRKRHQAANDDSVIEKLENYIDAIIIHGDERLIGLNSTFSQLGQIAKYTHYSGYVVADLPPRAIIPDKEVLIHAGSGSGGEDFFNAVASAWPHSGLQGLTWHFVTGPRFSNRAHEQLVGKLTQLGTVHLPDARIRARGKSRATDDGSFIVERYRPDLTGLMARATLSVSLAGYNTTQELLALKASALLVPKFRNTETGWTDAEQEYRLLQLQKYGLVHTLMPSKVVNPQNLAAAMEEALTHKLHPTRKINFDGARTTAHLLTRLHELHQHKPKVA